MQISKQDIGRAGEFLVMSRLSGLGYYVVHSDSYSDDIWIKMPDGKLYTIQVKTVTEHKKRGVASGHKYTFICKSSAADFFALVALDQERIIYKTHQQFSTQTLRIHHQKFTREAEHDSLLFCLDHVADAGAGDANIP
jgi:hypothetical protein